MANQLVNRQILDVRSQEEFHEFPLPSALHIPIDELLHRHRELDYGTPYIIICAHGVRSITACEYLLSKGYDAINYPGGIAALLEQPLPLKFSS